VHGIAGRKLWETWYTMRGLLRSGGVNLAPLVTHRFRLEEYETAFATMASGESGKVVMFP
jgi:threonine 3-dehydrogenase